MFAANRNLNLYDTTTIYDKIDVVLMFPRSFIVRTALLAIIGFMPTHGSGAIGSLDYTPDERKILARR